MKADLPQRKPTRLKGYNYSTNGAYFLTLCAKEKKPLFGTVSVGGGVLDAPLVALTDAGCAIEKQIAAISVHYAHLLIDKQVIMPNHIHLLVLLRGAPGGPSGMPAPTANAEIPALVSTLKRLSNKSYGTNLWQRGYHDHVVREEADYLRIWSYIDENPAHWLDDSYYTED